MIVAPARLVLQPPSFIDYLYAETEVLEPNALLMPKTKSEIEQWKEAVGVGFQEGLQHANDVFEQAMDKLVADYRGILKFKLLAKRGLVRIPVLATGELGIQIGKDILSVDQKIFRITVPASFKLQGE